jgi:hypothetical protein
VNDEIKKLVDQYNSEAATATFKRRAELEHMLWSLAGQDIRAKFDKRDWLHSLLGGAKPDFDYRWFLFNQGAKADVLWDRIERFERAKGELGGMAISRACQMYREAREQAELRGLDVRDTIAELLVEMEKDPVRHTQEGKLYHAKSGARLPSLKEASAAPARRTKSAELGDSERAFFDAVRTLAGQYIAKRLTDIDPVLAERLYRDFEADLRVVLDEFGGKVSRARQYEKSAASIATDVPRRQVVEASRLLGVDPPKAGKPVDLVSAKKHQKRLAREYHPDTHGGSEHTRAQYEAVIAAYLTLQKYNESLGAQSVKTG